VQTVFWSNAFPDAYQGNHTRPLRSHIRNIAPDYCKGNHESQLERQNLTLRYVPPNLLPIVTEICIGDYLWDTTCWIDKAIKALFLRMHNNFAH